MKKHISYLLALLLLCSLLITACGQSADPLPPAGAAQAEPEDEGIDDDAEPQPEASTYTADIGGNTGRYDGTVLSFSVREGDRWIEAADGIYVLYQEPSEEYKQLMREHLVMNEYTNMTEEEFKEQVEISCQSPVQFMTVFDDDRHNLEWYYDETIPDAPAAAEACYQSYVSSQYVESNEIGLGRVGRYTSSCGGQPMYVVWHVASSFEFGWVTLYESFVDSPAGTIVSFNYSISEEKTETSVQYVLDSVEFK